MISQLSRKFQNVLQGTIFASVLLLADDLKGLATWLEDQQGFYIWTHPLCNGCLWKKTLFRFANLRNLISRKRKSESKSEAFKWCKLCQRACSNFLALSFFRSRFSALLNRFFYVCKMGFPCQQFSAHIIKDFLAYLRKQRDDCQIRSRYVHVICETGRWGPSVDPRLSLWNLGNLCVLNSWSLEAETDLKMEQRQKKSIKKRISFSLFNKSYLHLVWHGYLPFLGVAMCHVDVQKKQRQKRTRPTYLSRNVVK